MTARSHTRTRRNARRSLRAHAAKRSAAMRRRIVPGPTENLPAPRPARRNQTVASNASESLRKGGRDRGTTNTTIEGEHQ